jgi:membrane protein involved in colicin uptake
MKSRYAVLFLSLVLALALAVPALGGPTNPIASISASVKSIANKALKKAKTAQKTANTANTTANSALTEAKKALTAAGGAQTTANTAQTEAKKAQTTANTAKTAADAAQTTANTAKSAADAAQATANSKFGNTFSEFGTVEGPNTTSGSSLVICPTGSQVTGGGYETSGTGANEVVPIFDSSYGDAWLAALQRIPGQADTWSVRAVVVCAEP